ncbi:SDR family NAD(P)-dependent oxidoreductase [Enterovirga rhinocerotis]|uniref:NAD(P)-dependent dehydrogenase (Short-subunit alcohol dehydrogenase family) n=1 Tax=Enterovirga rhinocerotis TaxID=1339210 RepID=A0A4R7C5Q9_9HYPH|nr:SDR family oxidoreductase [Enterovirga rhinocerotis]TDR93232.1 NAD(P)-dependent dehydrogenase (short-subunit alcohol dehydrogenase family) [Enterovirga rhinocerotis]
MPEAQNLHRLDGRTALVTGAGAGIGAAVAVGLAAAGASVVLVGRRSGPLDEVAAAVAQAGGTASVRPCDVLDTEAFRAIVAGLDRLDILVNNAGTNIPEPMLEVSEDHLDQVLNLNVRSLYLASQAGIRKMLDRPDRRSIGGAVINVSSQMGHVGSPNRTVYCMTKHALEGLTKAMAVELAPQGIRVNTLCPTFTDTPLVRRVVDTDEKRDYLYSRIPMGRLATVEEVAAGAVFLASPAAAMITGTHLLVDGGWTAQ